MKYDIKTSLALIKNSIKINDVISKLGLEYQDKTKYHILSPFTDEKTPSCYINTETNTFKCYSSGDRYGDIINFVRYYNGSSLNDSFSWFESNFGIDLPKKEPTEEERQLQVYYDIHRKAAEFFHSNLRKTDKAYEYIRSRITDDSIDKFIVGYSSNEIDLIEYLTDLGHVHKDLVTVGLASTNHFNGSIRLDDTISFPIWDTHNNICRFHFRTKTKAKYIGSPGSSPIFQHVLYGLNFAERHNDIVIVEGQFDVIACHEKGVKNVAALLGTNYLHEYGRQSKERGYRRLIFCFDGDQAGRNAALKLATTRIKTPSLFATIESDPGETGGGDLREAISRAKTPVEFYIDSLQMETRGASSTKNLLLKIREDLRNIDNLDKRLVVERLAHDLQLPEDEIAESIICKDTIQDLNVEQHCLYMAIEDLVWFKHLLSFKEDYFTTHKHKEIFNKIQSYAKLHSHSRDAILRYLGNLTIDSNQKYKIEFCIEDIEDKYHRRNALEKLKKAEFQIYDINRPLEDVIANFRAGLTLSADLYSSTPGKDIEEVRKYVYDNIHNENPGGQKLNNDRWGALNECWLGIQKGKYYGIGANTNVGKSICGTNWFHDLALETKTPCVFISREMSKIDIIVRAASINTGISNKKFQKGELTKDQLAMFDDMCDEYARSPSYVVKPKKMTASEWLAIIDYYYYNHAVEMFFVDYLQLAQPEDDETKMQDWQVVGKASGKLQERAQQPGKEVAIIGMSQLGASAKKSILPQNENTGGAYKIAQDLDNYLMITEKTRGEIHEQGIQHGNIKIHNVKARGCQKGQMWNGFLDNGVYGVGNLRMGMLKQT